MSGAETFDLDAPLRRGITLLEASAGTGKTYQITTLVLRLVTEGGVPVRGVLVVTFTRAATAELRDRIRRRLSEAAEAFSAPENRPEDETLAALLDRAKAAGEVAAWRDRLVEAQQNFDQITISTIHGFCQRMLQQNAFESGITFGETLVRDERELREEVVDDYLSSRFNVADRAHHERLARTGLFTRTELLALIRAAVEDPELEVRPADDVDAEARRGAVAEVLEELRTRRGEIEAVYAEAQASGGPLQKSRKWKPAALAEKLDAIESGLARAAKLDANWGDELSLLSFDVFQDTKGYPAFRMPEALARVAARVRTLDDDVAVARARFVAWARQEMEARHRARATQSFQDLVRRLAAALRDPARSEAVAHAIGSRFTAALIDEFQDTDRAQWEIFSRCFGTKRHFAYLIGDPKQAIYGFRGANVHVYLGARASADARYTMDRNYRSDGGYVRAMNELFAPTPAAGATVFGGSVDGQGITYPEVGHDERRRPEARLKWPEGDARAPLELRWCGPDLVGASSRGKPSNKDVMRALVPCVAQDIVELLQTAPSIHEDEAWRAIGPGDIAVLVRRKTQARAIQDALTARGVPSVIAGSGNVFESDEAREMLLWLAAITSPGDDRAARAAAITPAFGWTGDMLAALEAEDPDTMVAWSEWLDALSQARTSFAERGFMAALRRCMARFDVARRLLESRGGARRLTNFLHVAELVHAATSTERLHLAGAMRWLSERIADPMRDPDEAAELRLEGDEAAVRVVTVHASKGLQYPVVFVPFGWCADAKDPGKRPLVVPDPATPTLRRLDVHDDAAHPERMAHVRAHEADTIREGARLMYVALTRAQMRCVVYSAFAKELSDAALATLLHAGEAFGDDRFEATKLRVESAEASELLADLHRFASDQIEVSEATAAELATRWTAPDEHPDRLAARDFHRFGLDLAWGRSSFTSMVEGHGGASTPTDAMREGLDHDLVDDHARAFSAPVSDLPDPPTREEDAAETVPLGDFPAGAGPGTFLHAIYELTDFTGLAPASGSGPLAELQTRTESLAALHGIDLEGEAFDGKAWREVLPVALAETMRTPLGGPLGDRRLCDVPRTHRLDELRFDLPVAGGHEHRAPMGPDRGARRHAHVPVSDRAFVEALRSDPGTEAGGLPAHYLERLGTLDFGRIAGYLTGSIDLVFATPPDAAGDPMRDRVWWVVDYKSNRLDLRRRGHVTIDNYCPAWMEAEMGHHHYFIQMHLYTLALHRYLKHRLAGYEYAKHIGGAYYLFVRGLVGPSTPVDPSGRRYGAYFARPAERVIEALDRLFEGSGPEGGAA